MATTRPWRGAGEAACSTPSVRSSPNPRQRRRPNAGSTGRERHRGRGGVLAEALAGERREAGPKDEPPSYEAIDSNPINSLFMTLFRAKVVERVGWDSPLEGYPGLIEVVRVMNTKSMSSRDIQSKSRVVLQSLFPSWLPPAFRAMFARPLPELSLHMNALITALACKWLMGETELNTVEVESSTDGEVRTLPGVKVERCRYLEEIGCASACMNSCKFPTQEFFKSDMGIDVTLEPDYDDFSCQFVFGKKAPAPEEDEACQTPCFSQCTFPKAGQLRDGLCPSQYRD